MELNELDEFINGYIEKLPANKVISATQAENRATDFLYAQGIISASRRVIEDDMVLLGTEVAIQYAKGISIADGKNVTEKKINVELIEDYTNIKEALGKLGNVITFIKTHEKIFENAHIFYRNLYRGDK